MQRHRAAKLISLQIISTFIITVYSINFSCLAETLSKSQADFRFKSASLSNLISNVTVNDTIQDSYGFIWIATRDGLNRFDGIHNVIYRPSEKRAGSISHFYISRLAIDSNNTLWVGTEEGLNKYNAKRDSFSLNHVISSSAITKIYEDSKNQLWVGTRNNGLFLISSDRTNTKKIKLNNQPTEVYIRDIVEDLDAGIFVLSNETIYSYNNDEDNFEEKHLTHPSDKYSKTRNSTLHVFGRNSLLVGTKKGAFLYDSVTKKSSDFFPNILGEENISKITAFDKNNILVGTWSNGLFLVNNDDQTFQQFKSTVANKYSLSDDQIQSIYRTNNNIFWIGTNNGINSLNLDQKAFGSIIATKETSNCISGNLIYALHLDLDNNLWLPSYGKTLHKINLDNGHCENIASNLSQKLRQALTKVVSIHEDKNNNIWFGTFGFGLIQYNTQENKYFLHTASSETKSLNSNKINAITSDTNGNIWLGLFASGFSKFDLKSNSFINYQPTFKKNKILQTVNGIYSDKDDNIWLASQNNGLVKYIPSENRYLQYIRKNNQSKGIPPTLISIDLNHDNNFWVGTRGYGAYLFNRETNTTRSYSIENGLKNNIVMRSVKDSNNNSWLYTDKGLTLISHENNVLHTYLETDGLQSNATTGSGFYEKKNNRLWIAGVNGINAISLDKLPIKNNDTLPLITGFDLDHKSVSISNTHLETPLKESIVTAREIILEYTQDVFAFTFSAMNFKNPTGTKYAFKLEGYDNWNYVNADKNYASYTNIEPGDYVFRVKSSQDDNWAQENTSIKITISPPWWETVIARIIFIAIIILTLVFFISYRTRSLRKRSIQLEHSVKIRTKELATEKKKVEQLLSYKNDEFANVSHEFRTPLTLILGPLNQLLKTKHNTEDNNRLNIIQRNSYRLLRMVDQLLNMETFRIKSISKKIPQATGKTIRLITEAFTDLAKEKEIDLKIVSIAEANFEFTADALEKIILNLLSNAVKYSKPGDTISVETIRTPDNQLKIKVTDTGIGIPKDKLSAVFERYNRVLDENSEQVTGAGIGLALVKELVEAHQGTITIESELGKGTAITIIFPIIGEVDISQVNSHSNDEVIAMELMGLSDHSNLLAGTDSETTELVDSNTSNRNKPTVLVIEDNHDMREYIRSSINNDFIVFTANNGEQGLEKALEEVPDLIISDVMMPKMDGYQTTHALRTNDITNHIPIILLTARGDRESRLKGWHEKADEYLTKPFDIEELKIRLNNLLEIRNILKKRFAETVFVNQEKITQVLTVEDNEDTDLERSNLIHEKFIISLNKIMEDAYSDPETSVAGIAKSLAMSERQFFRKLKSVLDMTPAEYLRRFRLEKSKTILEQGQSASYAAFEVGFSSQSYFGKCFKAQYGLSPRDYKKEQ